MHFLCLLLVSLKMRSVCPCGCVPACVGRGLTAARCHSSPPRCSARGNVCVLSHAFLFSILMHDGNKEREYESWTRRTKLRCIFYKKKQKWFVYSEMFVVCFMTNKLLSEMLLNICTARHAAQWKNLNKSAQLLAETC